MLERRKRKRLKWFLEQSKGERIKMYSELPNSYKVKE